MAYPCPVDTFDFKRHLYTRWLSIESLFTCVQSGVWKTESTLLLLEVNLDSVWTEGHLPFLCVWNLTQSIHNYTLAGLTPVSPRPAQASKIEAAQECVESWKLVQSVGAEFARRPKEHQWSLSSWKWIFGNQPRVSECPWYRNVFETRTTLDLMEALAITLTVSWWEPGRY